MYADEKVSGISVNTKQYEEKEQIMSRIHFVILTWNSEKVIGQCLASMMQFREFEVNVCIVDNGSQDRTVDVVEQMIREGIPDTALFRSYGFWKIWEQPSAAI